MKNMKNDSELILGHQLAKTIFQFCYLAKQCEAFSCSLKMLRSFRNLKTFQIIDVFQVCKFLFLVKTGEFVREICGQYGLFWHGDC